MPDKHIIDQLLKTLSGLHAEVLLFDENGKSIPAGFEKQIPIFAELGGMAVRDGWTWMRVNAAAVSYICAEGEDQAAADCVRLAAALAESLIAEPMANDRTDVLRAALGAVIYGVDGVANYNIAVPAADVTAAADELPVLGTLTVTEMEVSG